MSDFRTKRLSWQEYAAWTTQVAKNHNPQLRYGQRFLNDHDFPPNDTLYYMEKESHAENYILTNYVDMFNEGKNISQ